ncbi:MAG TPA: translocation/assembly module TamB domain-containing protein, partial [Puia sp.]|nr:translocation/assembly module TamB domain-containing protein [Puia sp.]
IQLEDLTARVVRQSPDTVFNYQFIIDAFAGKPAPPKSDSAGTPMQIAVQLLEMRRIRLVYDDSVTGNYAMAYIGHDRTTIGGLDLDHLLIASPDMELRNSILEYRNRQHVLATSISFGSLHTHELHLDLQRLIFHSGDLRLDSAAFAFDSGKRPRDKNGVDYTHLLVKDLSLAGEELTYSPDSAGGRITRGELAEQSGFRLSRLQTRFFYSDQRLSLQDLLLQTPGTLLRRTVSLQCDSLAGMMKTPAHTLLALDMPDSRVQLKDILFFAPQLRTQPFFRHPADVWRLSANVRGSLDALTIQGLQCSGPGDLRLDAKGRVLHPFDTRRLWADIQLRELSGTSAALAGLLPPNTLPSSITIPARYRLQGRLTGDLDGFNTDLGAKTSSGSARIVGYAHHLRSKTGIQYDLGLTTDALDLGAILQDTVEYGAVTANFSIRGTGLDIHTANAGFKGSVTSATFRRHTYHGLELDGSLAAQQATLHSAIHDSSVHFELQATADIAHKFPALRLDWKIDTLDLHAIGLTRDTLSFKGHLLADFEDTNPDSLQGSLRLAGIDLLKGKDHIVTDSIILEATQQQGLEHIRLHSELAALDLNGRYRLTEIATALQHTIHRYYPIEGFRDTVFAAQDWTLRMNFRASPLVLSFMPSLSGTDSIGGVVTYNSAQDAFHLLLKTPRITMGTQYFHDVAVEADTHEGRLDYAVTMADGHGSGFEFYRTSLMGALGDSGLTATLLLKDRKEKDRYRLAAVLDKNAAFKRFRLDPDSLMLNYEAWKVDRDNYIQFGGGGFVVHDLTLSNKNDSLSVTSREASPTSPIDVRFAGFHISTLTHFAEQDSLLIDGTIDGHAEVRNLTTAPVFTSDLKVTALSYKNDTIGNLAVKVNNEKANALSADISLEGHDNDVRVKGDYYTGEGRMDMKIDLTSLNLAAFTSAAKEWVDDMKGRLKGQLALTGTMSKPLIKGNLSFDSALIVPAISGEPLRVSEDKIGFDEDGFNFSQFRLLDSAGNKLVIDGNVFTKDYRDFGFDISVNAANFRLVNAAQASNREFYGQLNLDAGINLEGKMDAPKVDGDIRVNRKTNFYFVLPGDDPEVVDRLGVVRFIDKDHPGDTLVDRAAIALRKRQTDIRGMNVSMNIQTDSNAIFTIVIDERSGDALNVRGRSNLVFGMNNSGKMDLTGAYEVEGGSYNLSLDVLKRKFDIQRGSTITWTGDPLTATLDMTATYTATTPSIDLIANEVAGRSESDVNKFKEKLPFLVTLKMEGELMKPKITFDITLPPNILTLWPDVDARLQQIRQEESELNKQVFALLLLNRFVGEDPLQSQAGGGSSIGSMAFQSASQILTSQLDQLAASLIKGVDIHFDLNNEQDYSTGNEIDYTELNVTVSKSFSERIQVSVGSNFDVVGAGAPNQNASTLAGDVAVNYKLSKDGRYMLRAYRQNQYEAVVEGQVVETGLSFILTFDYNTLKELFHRSQDQQLQERKITKPSKSSTP